jgi:Tfp pilus assembly protein PilX
MLAIPGLFIAAGYAQSPDRTFYPTQPSTLGDLASVANVLRTIVDLQAVSVDRAHNALVANGTADQMALTEWLFHQLDRPVGQTPPSATPEYRMAGENGDGVRVFRMDPSVSETDLYVLASAIMNISDAQRTSQYASRRASVVRSSMDRLDAAEWLFHQLSMPAGQTLSADSPAYHPVAFKNEDNPVIRVFRVAPNISVPALSGVITAVRTTTDVQRVSRYEAAKALAMRGSAVKVAAAEWLIHELGKPADAAQLAAKHEYQMPGLADGVVRVFYPARGNAQDVSALTTQIRTTTQNARVCPLEEPRHAIVLRGRPDQMPPTEALVAKFDAAGR